MSYSLVIPPHLVEGLYHIRTKTGVSIRQQILTAIEQHLKGASSQSPPSANGPLCTTNFLREGSIDAIEVSQMGLEEELMQFTGTENYYRNFTGLVFTDGVKYLADKAGAYWLIDLVGSYQPRLRKMPFQLWELKVKDDKSALITMVEDIGRPTKIRQQIPSTDFPLKEFSFYCIDNVMLLKSEY